MILVSHFLMSKIVATNDKRQNVKQQIVLDQLTETKYKLSPNWLKKLNANLI